MAEVEAERTLGAARRFPYHGHRISDSFDEQVGTSLVRTMLVHFQKQLLRLSRAFHLHDDRLGANFFADHFHFPTLQLHARGFAQPKSLIVHNRQSSRRR